MDCQTRKAYQCDNFQKCDNEACKKIVIMIKELLKYDKVNDIVINEH